MAINTMDSSGAQVDPTYNFDLEQARIARQRALAQKLAEIQQPQGQMVSGWYVAPRGGAYLAAGLDKMMGAFATQQADKDEKDNIASGNANAVALAKQLAELKGKEKLDYGTTNSGDAMGPPQVSYEAPTFNDKLPFYQQLANSGKFGQLVAQKEMDKDLAGPTHVTVGEGQTTYMIGRDGKPIGVLNGGAKETDFMKRVRESARLHDISLEEAWRLESQKIDGQSGLMAGPYDDLKPRVQAPAQQTTAAANNSGGAVPVPAKGQSWAGPDAAGAGVQSQPTAPTVAANPADYRAKKAAQEQAAEQAKQKAHNAPKVEEAQAEVNGITTAVTDAKRALELAKDKSKSNFGVVSGRAFMLSDTSQELKSIFTRLVLASANGKLGGGMSDADRKFLEAGEASLLLPRDVVIARLNSVISKLEQNKTAKHELIKSLGGTVAAPAAETTSAAPGFKW